MQLLDGNGKRRQLAKESRQVQRTGASPSPSTVSHLQLHLKLVLGSLSLIFIIFSMLFDLFIVDTNCAIFDELQVFRSSWSVPFNKSRNVSHRIDTRSTLSSVYFMRRRDGLPRDGMGAGFKSTLVGVIKLFPYSFNQLPCRRVHGGGL